MKVFAKILMVGAVAVVAIAISAAPSEAAKKKRMAMKPTTCTAPALCSAECQGGGCKVNFCGPSDGKWYWSPLTPWCIGGACPPKC